MEIKYSIGSTKVKKKINECHLLDIYGEKLYMQTLAETIFFTAPTKPQIFSQRNYKNQPDKKGIQPHISHMVVSSEEDTVRRLIL